MFFRRGDLPEPPPDWAKTLAPGYTVKRMGSMDDLDAYLRANHVEAGRASATWRFQGGVIPSKREVVLPAEGLLKDPKLEQAIAEHEYGHTHGLVHHEGRGWFEGGPDMARVVIPIDNVFARPAETGATRNLFKGP